ncbi:hypothetical protein B0J12DRAFT_323019 [Macrophomina phaseolina]|uniref:Secreted protein n=1 Tax=Macrophomina phaseolina TaxID=35725 RepID=A0ABQ8FVL2_9PEZI|nr:hypothetical protein B0J12DRAFT_323019 [Macrophomina phaseolina]
MMPLPVVPVMGVLLFCQRHSSCSWTVPSSSRISLAPKVACYSASFCHCRTGRQLRARKPVAGLIREAGRGNASASLFLLIYLRPCDVLSSRNSQLIRMPAPTAHKHHAHTTLHIAAGAPVSYSISIYLGRQSLGLAISIITRSSFSHP